MSLVDAAVHGLRARVGGLRSDMASWTERAAKGGDLLRHHSQIERLHEFLEGFLDEVAAGTPIRPGAGAVATGIGAVPGWRRDIGTVHLLWEFYRDKLAQRDMSGVVDHLGVADDLAYACYQPFLDQAIRAGGAAFPAERVKAPPLVFYATDRTPFAKARSKTLHPAGLDAKDVEEFAAALRELPVPVIGVPWETANRMPETVLVGHEAGHVVAEDLGLGAEARRALATARFADDDGSRAAVWQSWCDEVFADVIGILATGRAFVDGLTVELVGDRNEVRLAPIELRDPGAYPTPMLRVALCEAVLARLGVAASPAWTQAYGAVVADAEVFADDVETVVAALLDREWVALGGLRLAAVLPWDGVHEGKARKVAEKALQKQDAPVKFDLRIWVAAGMHAHRADPVRYADTGLDAVLAARIGAAREEGVRSTEPQREAQIFGEALPAPITVTETLHAADRRAGAALARRLRDR